MYGIEEAYCNTAISALLEANYALMESTLADALQPIRVHSKKDTLGLDAKPEITISERIKSFDQYATLLTEERGEDTNPLVKHDFEGRNATRTYFVCDPTDRSSQLRSYLERFRNEKPALSKVSEVLTRDACQSDWEVLFGGPSSITGSFSALTCIRNGVPICAVLLNYITQELFVACGAGTYKVNLPRFNTATPLNQIDLKYCVRNGTQLRFRHVAAEHWTRFVTYLGKGVYGQNLLDLKLIREDEIENDLHYDLPGGPSRVLYLSEQQPEERPIGFIVANGEKIGEWIHWLAFVRFGTRSEDMGKAPLRAFEIYLDRPWTREGILMSTSPIYSIFSNDDSILRQTVIDVERLQVFPNPSKYRETLLITSASNHRLIQIVQQYGHRSIDFASP